MGNREKIRPSYITDKEGITGKEQPVHLLLIWVTI